MTTRKTVTAVLVAGATLFALAPSALASPAGSEYLPKVPQSGSQSSGSGSGSSATPTTSTSDTTGKGNDSKKSTKKEQKRDRGAVPASSDQGGGDSSGGSLLSPLTLLIAVAILAMIAWAIRRRRKARADPPGKPSSRPSELAGPDNTP